MLLMCDYLISNWDLSNMLHMPDYANKYLGYMGGGWSWWTLIWGKLGYAVLFSFFLDPFYFYIMLNFMLQELIALGDVVGTESRGLSADTIASLPSINYNSQDIQEGSSDS